MTSPQPKAQSPLEPFTPRERDVLALLAEGLSNREIGQQLHIAEDTVKWYNHQIFRKLDVSSRIQAANKARELNLLSQPQPIEIRQTFNLPNYLTTFIGRETELESIQHCLQEHRLVTVTGVGGSGKTRLVSQVGHEMAGNFEDGVGFVSLATVSDVDRVAIAIGQSLDCKVSLGKSTEEVLVDFLYDKEMLLILDNFEHVIEESTLLTFILDNTKHVRLLVTSRERLRLDYEYEFALDPMQTPDTEAALNTETILGSEAVRLFVNRLLTNQPDLELSDDDIRIIAGICTCLDGLPLALELAAVRHKVLSLGDIQKLLQDRFGLLTSGARDLPTRQQTLRATIDWSYDLMTTAEQRLFCELAIFRGSASRVGIKAVCMDSEDAVDDVDDGLSSLLDKRLIQIGEGLDGELRYWMLETLREYGLEQLESNNMLAIVKQRYGQFVADFASDAWHNYHNGIDQELWSRRTETELDNIREAMHLSILDGQYEIAVRIYNSTALWWVIFQKLNEGYQWSEQILQLRTEVSSRLQGALLLKAAHIFIRCGQRERAAASLEEAATTFKAIDEPTFYAWSLMHLCRATNSIEHANTAMDIFKRLEDYPGQCAMQVVFGEHYHLLKDYAKAQSYYEQALHDIRKHNNPSMEVTVINDLALLKVQQGDYQAAQGDFMEALSLAESIKSPQTCVESLAGLGSLAVATNSLDVAARLFGFVEEWHQENGSRFDLVDQAVFDHYQKMLQDLLSPDRYVELTSDGKEMSLEQAISYARP